MKCPKCGYTSFEFHDSCTKCSSDLTGFKTTYGLKSIVLPQQARTTMAESLSDEKPGQAADPVEVPSDMFSFDLPDEPATTRPAPPLQDDPFRFDDDPVAAPASGGDFSFGNDTQSIQGNAEVDAFADLLESTPHKNDNPFSEPPTAPVQAAPVQAAVGTGEFDMNSFSWDDPAPVTESATGKPTEDDFNSLFGDKDNTSK